MIKTDRVKYQDLEAKLNEIGKDNIISIIATPSSSDICDYTIIYEGEE